ncbi:MAG: replicative helicase loader/inhibitor [Bacillota bacterium]
MKKAEIIKLFGLITVLYPRDTAFSRPSESMVDAWAAMLEDMTLDTAAAALQRHAALCPFPPSIAELRAAMLPRGLGADEAWGIALRAIRKGGVYRPEKAREIAGPEVWPLMERMGYRDMCMTENADVLRGQFTRLWDARQKRRTENALLPPSIKRMALGQAGRAARPGLKSSD